MFLPQFCIRNSVRMAYAIITENCKVTWTIVICRAYRDDMLIGKTQRASSRSQLLTRTRYSGNNLHSNRQLVKNKYFGLKNSWAAASPRTPCCLQSQVRTWHARTMQWHMPIQKVWSTQLHPRMGTQTQTDCVNIIISSNPSSFGVAPNNLASHARVTLL